MSSDEAGQKAMLYFIEVLMNSGQSLSVEQLASRFSTPCFTSDMKKAAGGHAAGLKEFLTKYTSLFVVEGDSVSINNHGVTVPTMSETSAYPELHIESEAVKYFEDHLTRKGGRAPVRSLAGHISQAPPRIRTCVGPQAEFIRFLGQHPDNFVIDGDSVYLPGNSSAPRKEPVAANVNGHSDVVTTKRSDSSRSAKPSPISMTASEYKAMKFVKDEVETTGGKDGVVVGELVKKAAEDAPAALKAILGLSCASLLDFVGRFTTIFTISDGDSSDEERKLVSVRKTRLNVVMQGSRPSGVSPAPANQTREKNGGRAPEEIVRPNGRDASTDDVFESASQMSKENGNGTVATNGTEGKPQERTSSTSSSSLPRTVNNSFGPIYHMAKLWGILDLGKHEHVFFDRSILPDNYDDLTKQFKIGENLRFNAVRAARGSRARWRATHIWRDGQDIRSMYGDNSMFSLTPLCSDRVEEEVKKLLPPDGEGKGDVSSASSRTRSSRGESSSSDDSGSQSNGGKPSSPYTDASPTVTGCVPVWKPGSVPSGGQSGDSTEVAPCLKMVPEVTLMKEGVSIDARYIPGYLPVPVPTAGGVVNGGGETISVVTQNGDGSKFRDVACQTVSTGEIMATQLYDDIN